MYIFRSGKGWFQKGQAFYNEKEYDQALVYFTKAAEVNHTHAQLYLGDMYYSGIGTAKDLNKALLWYIKAAEGGSTGGQRMAGTLYCDGSVGGKPDFQQAWGWFQKAVINGDVDALGLIGNMYLEGNGVEKDYKIALDWYKQAADKGHMAAPAAAGYVYMIGRYGVDQNYDEAESWIMKGVEYDDPNSMHFMGMLYGLRTDSKQDWKKAFEWIMKAAKLNDSDAQHTLGDLYLRGLGCEKSYTVAMEWYKIAEENGNMDATASIGIMHHWGYGVPINYSKALTKYQKAGENRNALNGKGLLYQNGLGVAQSHNTAMWYFEKAAKMDCGDAFNSIGDVYKYGYDRTIDLYTAFKNYTKAAECMSNKGMFNLGLMYMEGLGVDANKEMGLHWLRRASSLGNKEANEYIRNSVSDSPQLPRIISITEADQRSIKETQLHSLEERLASLMTENELLRRKFSNNESRITNSFAKAKTAESLKFVEAQNEDVITEKKEAMKFFSL